MLPRASEFLLHRLARGHVYDKALDAGDHTGIVTIPLRAVEYPAPRPVAVLHPVFQFERAPRRRTGPPILPRACAVVGMDQLEEDLRTFDELLRRNAKQGQRARAHEVHFPETIVLVAIDHAGYVRDQRPLQALGLDQRLG